MKSTLNCRLISYMVQDCLLSWFAFWNAVVTKDMLHSFTHHSFLKSMRYFLVVQNVRAELCPFLCSWFRVYFPTSKVGSSVQNTAIYLFKWQNECQTPRLSLINSFILFCLVREQISPLNLFIFMKYCAWGNLLRTWAIQMFAAWRCGRYHRGSCHKRHMDL